MSVLEVHDVSIRYITGDFKDIGLKEFAMKKLKGEYHVTEFWADRNVSFRLEKGDMLGIIGTNGAGKSTLLKAVTGIMEPTTGYVKREGNIAALLELASGFDGDLTVRENAYLRGAMLGYTRKFMDETYEQIIDFAELWDFQDRPFRQLSSGMKSRLAFSIASLVQPDILILDEVLSVGDGAFRKKSEEKMREIISGGATTILVSHSLEQVRGMCNKVLWLDQGEQVLFSDDVEGTCDKYQEYLEGKVRLEDLYDLRGRGVRQEMNEKDARTATMKGQTAALQKIKMMGSPLVTLIILAELFLMFLMSFPRLDDLTWGGTIGLQRLSTWFAGYNGRYVGNIVVMILTRLPAGIRAGVELAILCALFYYAHRLLPKGGASCFFALALLCLPLPVYAQSVVWTAGFANFTTSAVIMLFAMDTYCRVVLRGEGLSPLEHTAFMIVSFLGQLIVENTTFYTVVLAACFLAYGAIGKRKLYVPVVTGLISSVCGAVLMFSNSSYHSALVKDGNNYKVISTSLLELWEAYQNDVVPHLVQNNHIINIVLTVALLLLWVTKESGKDRKKASPWIGRSGCLCGSALIAFFIYDMMDSTMKRVINYGATVYAIIALFYAAYILVTIFVTVTDDMQRSMLLVFACSQVVLAAPLVPASPLSARCFFQNGILWCLMLGYITQILLDRVDLRFDEKVVVPKLAVITQIACAFYLMFVLCGQSMSWQIQRIRTEVTQAAIENKAETIVLPEVPWSSVYCFGANISSSNTYWISNYKDYYGIPEDITLEFMDYYKWDAMYGGG